MKAYILVNKRASECNRDLLSFLHNNINSIKKSSLIYAIVNLYNIIIKIIMVN